MPSQSGYVNPYDTLTSGNPSKIFNFPTSSSGGVVGPAPTGSQSTAVQQNVANAPDLTSLTNLVNSLNLSGQQAANAGRIPGAAGLEAQSSQNIGSELSGQLPQDVIDQLAQQGAERGVAMGSPGSPNANAGYLRALGLTSLQQQQLGQQNLSQAYARNPVAPLFNPTSMLLTPYQSGQLGVENARLGLDWWNALNRGGYSGGGGRAAAPVSAGDSGTPSWFPTVGGTPSPQAPPPSGGQGFVNDPNYPGTSMAGFPNLTSLLGTTDPGYGYSPDPFGQAPPTDFSNPGAWDFTGGGGEDPLLQLG